MNNKKTEKDKNVYRFIIQYIIDNGYPPTIREMMEGLNYNSSATVVDRLAKLEALGLIKIKHDSPRAIKVIGYNFVKENTDHAYKQ